MRPFLQGDDAARASAIARQIAARITDPRSTRGPRAGLAAGASGTSMVFRAMESIEPDRDWHATLHDHLARAASASNIGFSLFEGWSGLLAAAQYAAGKTERYAKLMRSVRDSLHAYVERTYGSSRAAVNDTIDYDIIGGAAGILLALNSEDDTQSARTIRDFFDRITADPSGQTWRAPFYVYRADGSFTIQDANNLGLAHGLPGMLAALALSRHIAEDDPLFSRMATWIIAQRMPGDGTQWACAVDGPRSFAERSVWCYGTPGVALAVCAAGERSANAGWIELSRDALLTVATQDERVWGIGDCGLCHGYAGLALIAASIGARANCEQLIIFAQSLMRRVIEEFDPDTQFGYTILETAGKREHNADLLGGAAGIALALLTGSERVDGGWLRYFCLV